MRWRAPARVRTHAPTHTGLGGAVVVYPFAAGFTSGILGEYLFGSLELPPFSDVPSTLFWVFSLARSLCLGISLGFRLFRYALPKP